ncbi:MAG: hypothetical protein ACI8UO_000324 [Verrucomicrobiales bacterium]|jgi:hypothetical protein
MSKTPHEEIEPRRLTSLLQSVEAAVVRLGFVGPFLRIWFRPRATTRQLLANDSSAFVLLLAVLTGLGMAITGQLLTTQFETDVFVAMLLIGLIAGMALGLVRLYLESALMTFVGLMCDGRGSFVELRCATAWSYGPEIAARLVWFPVVLSSNPSVDMPWVAERQNLFAGVAIALLVWRFGIQVRASLTAHGLLGSSGSLIGSRRLATIALTLASPVFFFVFLRCIEGPLVLLIFWFAASAESG